MTNNTEDKHKCRRCLQGDIPEDKMRKSNGTIINLCKRCHSEAVKLNYKKNRKRKRLHLGEMIGSVKSSKNYGDFKIIKVVGDIITIQFLKTGTVIEKSRSCINKGSVADPAQTQLVYGWGVNDVDYTLYENGKLCPIYEDWHGILERVFCPKYKLKQPTYKDVTVCEEWKYFSNFRDWVLNVQPNKDWKNCDLDKDLLSKELKIYSPETVVYLDHATNKFLLEHVSARGVHMIGVYWKKTNKRFAAQCSDPFSKSRGYLGLFDSELEAHKAWQSKKHEYACMLAELQNDSRAAQALRLRYSPDKDWTQR